MFSISDVVLRFKLARLKGNCGRKARTKNFGLFFRVKISRGFVLYPSTEFGADILIRAGDMFRYLVS